MTAKELADHNAYVAALDDGHGLQILDRHLKMLDEVRELCKKNPNKPKVREAIRAAVVACQEDQSKIGILAFEQREIKIRLGECVASPFGELHVATGSRQL